MSRRPLVVIGDTLLDRDVDGRVERLSPDAPVPVLDEERSDARPGGAGLAAALAALDGREVTLVTALGGAAGGEAGSRLAECGVEVVDLGLDGPTPEKVRFRTEGRPLLRVDRGGGERVAIGPATAAARAAIGWAATVLVADYGRGVAAEPGLREGLAELPRRVPVVWDPHPHGAVPMPGAQLVTPNEREAARFAPEPALEVRDVGEAASAVVAARAGALRSRWEAAHVCVTRGARGAVLVGGDPSPLVVSAPPVPGADPCGAGDRFASAVAGALADGARVPDAFQRAVESASEFVASGAAPRALQHRARRAPDGGASAAADAVEVAERVRGRGGTVVASGGCFDLLHAGHVATLEAARALGDCLVVCLNSDESVRRLKGPGRPLVGEADRTSVLEALACVDAVAVFDESTPEAVIERLRPDVWVKGGDYVAAELPEARVLARWGGRVAVLPYLHGRSTTRLIEEVSLGAIS